jgi:hypothetical protein
MEALIRRELPMRPPQGDGMRAPRVLYVSGSIGLGHVSKDLAIARELRQARPDIEIVWLAGHPASQVLRDAGERVAPECGRWVGASAIAERCTRGGQLNLVRYVYRSLPSWARNTRLFRAAVHAYDIDIAVGNEAWEVDIPLVLGVLRLSVPFVMIFDFLGCDAMTPSLWDNVGAYALNVLWASTPASTATAFAMVAGIRRCSSESRTTSRTRLSAGLYPTGASTRGPTTSSSATPSVSGLETSPTAPPGVMP